MNLNSLLNKAKETTDKAIDKASEVKDKAMDTAGVVKDRAVEVKDKAVEIKDKAAEFTGAAGEYGMDKMRDAIDATLQQLLSLRPVLARSGFTIGEIELILSLPPGVEVAIMHKGGFPDELKELEADPSLTQLQSLIIRSLRNAYALDGVFRKYNYTIGKLVIGASIPPKVKVVLKSYVAKDHPSLPAHPEPLQISTSVTEEKLLESGMEMAGAGAGSSITIDDEK